MRARRLEHIGMVHHLILYNKNTFYITKMAEILTTMATNNGKLQLQHQQQQQLLQLQQHQEQEQEHARIAHFVTVEFGSIYIDFFHLDFRY